MHEMAFHKLKISKLSRGSIPQDTLDCSRSTSPPPPHLVNPGNATGVDVKCVLVKSPYFNA